MTNIESESRPVVDEKQNFLNKLFNRKMSRRTVMNRTLQAGAVVGIAAVFGEAKFDPLNIIPNESGKEPDASVFDKLFARIGEIGDEKSRQETLEKAQELKTIIDINDRFMKAYLEDVDEDGNPHLLSLYREKYKHLGIENPEEMIFILQNDKAASKMILKPLQELFEGRGDIAQTIGKIRKDVDEDSSFDGEQIYVGGSHILLKDYLNADSRTGGELIIGPGSDEIDSDEARAKLDEDIRHLREEIEKIPNIDKTVKLWDEKYGQKNKYQGIGAGNFIELGEGSEINLSSIDKFLIYHEMAGHGLDVVLNDTQLLQYLSPEQFYKLYVKREECLSDKVWGRSYPEIKRIFGKREAVLPYSNIGPIGPDLVPEGFHEPYKDQTFLKSDQLLRVSRLGNDNYPDGIFCTGIYIDAPVTEDGNIFFQQRKDEDVIKEYRGLIDSNQTSFDLRRFLDKEDNAHLLGVMAEKSPWLGKVFKNLSDFADVLTGRLSWLEIKDKDSEEPIIKAPEIGASDSEWFDFCVGLGQRLAVINMFFNNSSDLDSLSEEGRATAVHQLRFSYNAADKEMFANLMAIIETNSFDSKNPFREYLDDIAGFLSLKSITASPSSELYAAVKRTGIGMANA